MIFSQRDPKWKNIKLGNGKTNIGSHGCFVTALAMLSGKTPPEVNEILKNGGYFQGDLIISSVKMAQSLGLEYHGRDNLVNYNPKYQTIAEVDMSPSPGKQQHFVVVNTDGSILDPWTGTQRPKGTYTLVSYRLFEKAIESYNLVDLSHWNLVKDWNKIKFPVILKCTESTNFLDPKYKEYSKEAMAKCLYAGSYHFFRDVDPVKQADWFLKNTINANRLVLDFEINCENPVEKCRKFLERIIEKTGKPDIYLYTNEARLKYDWTPVAKIAKLWVAKYLNSGLPGNPKTGAWKDWSIYQYTSKGKVEGIEGNVDLNIMKVIIQKPILSETLINDNEAQNSFLSEKNTEMGKDTIVEVKTSPEGKSEATSDLKMKYDYDKQAWVMDNNLFLNIMENVKDFFKDKRVRTFGWNMLGSFLGIVALYLGELNPSYGVVLIPVILAITKYINKTYLS
jgi:lysozyme